MGRSREIGRTFDSGAKKRIKQKKQQEFLKKQCGALNKFPGFNLKSTTSSKVNSKDDFTFPHSEVSINNINPNFSNISSTSTSYSTIEKDQFDNSFLNIKNLDDIKAPIISTSSCSSSAQSTSIIKICNQEKDNCFNNIAVSIANDDINNDAILLSKNDSVQHLVVDLNDPACWPQSMSHTTQIQIVERVDRMWLVYSKTADRVYCFVCKLFEPTLNTSLANVGCDDWGHLSHLLKCHERNKNHYINITKWIELKNRLSSSQTIDKEFLAVFDKEKRHWRGVLTRIIAVIKYLTKHSLAFRGKSDVIFTKNNGNFLGLIEMLSEFDPVIGEHINRIKNKETHDHYLGHQIQDELIHIIAEKIKENILSKIKQFKYYSVIMDSTPDINHQEQVSIVIRIVLMNSENSEDIISIKEYFLTFINVHSTTGLNISNTLKNQLDEYGLKLSNCGGQSYDNGSNMIGLYKGVQFRILQNNPRAFFVPCSAHSLNLVLRDSAKSSTKAITFFGYLGRIYNLFSASTHRWDIFKSHCNLYTVKQWSETRWESRINSVKAIRFQVKNVMHALSEILQTSDDPITKSEALSLLNEVGSFEFLLCLIIWYELLTEVNIVSKNFQNPNMQLDVSTNMLKGLIVFLEKYRDKGFEKAMETAKQLAIAIEIEPTFNEIRYRKKKRCFSYESVDETLQDPQQNFRTQYFLIILDSAIMSMSKRFNQINNFNSNFGFLYDVSKLKTMSDKEIRKHCQDLQIILTDGEDKDIDAIDLFEELLILREMVDNNMTALQILTLVKKSLGSFSNVEVALRILLTIPIASAGAERSFSKLKLIKNFLRNSLSQFKLAGLALIAIKSEIGDSLSLENILDTFAAQKARKKMF
ncbi:hypothetical protein QTP88_000663 [Uroleucon formosanum]